MPVVAPRLRLLSDVPPEAVAGLPALPRDGFELFLVTEGGEFDGQPFEAGEVLLCRGEARQGEATVLVARGVGRPRLGTVHGIRFRGDGGEPCHPARWRSAGKLVARCRMARDGWLVEVGARVAEARRSGGSARTARAAAGGRGERLPAAQLPLFAA